MEKDKVHSLLKARGWLDIAGFALTLLLAAFTIFSMALMQRDWMSDTAYDAGEAFMAAGILSFVFVMVVLGESVALAVLLAFGCVGFVFGIRALRRAKGEPPVRTLGSVRTFLVFTIIHVVFFAMVGWLCCMPASENGILLLPALAMLLANLGCLAASLSVKAVCLGRLKKQAVAVQC